MSDHARHVFLQFDLVLGTDEVLPALNREDNVDVDLCVGICHMRIEGKDTTAFKPFQTGCGGSVGPGDAAYVKLNIGGITTIVGPQG